MSETAIAFGDDQITRATFGEESVWYTWGPGQLGTGQTNVFSVTGWNPEGYPDKQVVLDRLQVDTSVTGASQVQIQWTADGIGSDPSQDYLDAMRGGKQTMRLYAPAVNSTRLDVFNNSGAAIANFQLNYRVTVRTLSIADKMANSFALTEDDQELLAAMPADAATGASAAARLAALLKDGVLPYDFDAWIRPRLFAGRKVAGPPAAVARHFVVGSSGSASVTIPAPQGGVVVLETLAPEGAQAGTVVRFDRDGKATQNGYVAVNSAAWVPADERPWRLWVPAARYLTCTVYNATAGTYTLRIGARSYTPGDLLACFLGLTKQPSLAYQRVRSGLF